MAVQKEIETECPMCENLITLVDFDPQDKSDETGQDIECPVCGEIFDDWTVDKDGEVTIVAEFEPSRGPEETEIEGLHFDDEEEDDDEDDDKD